MRINRRPVRRLARAAFTKLPWYDRVSEDDRVLARWVASLEALGGSATTKEVNVNLFRHIDEADQRIGGPGKVNHYVKNKVLRELGIMGGLHSDEAIHLDCTGEVV